MKFTIGTIVLLALNALVAARAPVIVGVATVSAERDDGLGFVRAGLAVRR